MIPYVEIRSAATRELIGIADTAKSIIWHTVYYGVGDFEIYAPCTPETVALLAVGNYVTRFDDRHVGIIESVNPTYSAQDGRMIVAAGRFAKSMLDRRVIYNLNGNSVSPTILSGSVEGAARQLVTANAIACPFDSGRNIAELTLGASAGITKTILDENGAAGEKQVTFNGLLEYTDDMLREYGLGAYCALNAAGALAYTVFEGADRSVDNTGGLQPVIFSQDFDNLLSSEYLYDEAGLKNTALIGGKGEGTERFCTVLKNATITGASRREMFVDASSSSNTYKDDAGTEHTLSNAEYEQQLRAQGMQQIAGRSIVETFNGEIDVTNGSFAYGENADYYLGDVVTIQDADVGLYINTRILEITEVQDENGYQINAVYG